MVLPLILKCLYAATMLFNIPRQGYSSESCHSATAPNSAHPQNKRLDWG